MASTKSTIVTRADTGGVKLVSGIIQGGMLREAVATVAVAIADANDHEYRLFRVQSHWRISQLLLWNDAITSGADYDIGLYDPEGRGGAVVDIDLFADAVSMTQARTAPLDVTYELNDIANIEKRVWELLGLDADPGLDYDLTLTGVAAGSGAGDISMLMRWAE